MHILWIDFHPWYNYYIDITSLFLFIRVTCSWLQEVITCVCICSSEFQAARAMAQLLSLSTDTHQVCKYTVMLSIFK